ncbi:MAG: hypothetical protein E6H54_01295 [Betaproteobacteria bacterium]|nr:MAG: hypothetical protein E6H54_01295 [Betaproteobacteria bacterium]
MKALLFAVALALPAGAQAQAFPSKVVKLVVAYAPGGATDVVTRAVAQRLSPMWAQPVIIENKPGANTNIAAGEVAKASADGYTLLSTAETTFAVNPYVYTQLPFDPAKDYVPVTGLGIVNQVLAVNPALPYKSVADVIAAAKAQPGKLNYAAFGPGSSPHLNMEMFLHMAGVQMTPVHYKGQNRTRRASFASSAWGAGSGSPRSPSCRPSPKAACRAMKPCRGSASSRRPARRAPSWRKSMPMCNAFCRMRTSARNSSRPTISSRSAARPRSSPRM